ILEQKNCNLTQVKIDEVLCLMCYIAAKISANNAVPSRVVFLVKFLKGREIYSILLHVLRHVCILDHSLSVRHCEPKAEQKVLRFCYSSFMHYTT
uniref:Uncharacterized protein n=1 Tax=Chelonoidis abingdonii TaxID=106734 RepID=A0A8C0IWC0_CHEAB